MNCPYNMNQSPHKKKPDPEKSGSGFNFNPGNVLLSHTVSRVVPSAMEGLTSEFGMGSGVSPSLWSPENLMTI